MAYHITLACYGTRLFGDPSGSVDRNHNLPRSPYLPVCQNRVAAIRRRLQETPLLLTPEYRKSVLAALTEVCWYRGWIPLGLHVRTTHLHAVVHALVAPEKIMNDFKAYATRTLNQKHGLLRHKNWARHGSTQYLWTQEDAEAAVCYVLFLQGRPMETYFAANVFRARTFV
ncbi:MAG: transposase [Acidobacteria bacterium]|nr:transposase [Acidobacteriota bacterium]